MQICIAKKSLSKATKTASFQKISSNSTSKENAKVLKKNPYECKKFVKLTGKWQNFKEICQFDEPFW